MEHIARSAGVSTASAYNHFPTKHVLIGHVYRPLVMALQAEAEQDVTLARPVVAALEDQVRALVRLTSRHRIVSGAFLAACQEYAARVHAPARPDDELDPRAIAPMPEAVRLLVAHGQATGELRAYPCADDISSVITTLLLVRAVEAPQEPPEATARLLLTVLFGTLLPERVAHKPLDGGPGAA